MPLCGRGDLEPGFLAFPAEDGVRRFQKKVLWTFFPPNRPTMPLCGRGDLESKFNNSSPQKMG